MRKLYIAKNKYGYYYCKISNQHQKCDLIMSVNLPKGVELAQNYGTFDCEYFVSCYKTKDGDIRPSIVVTKIVGGTAMDVNSNVNPEGAKALTSAYDDYNNATIEEPF